MGTLRQFILVLLALVLAFGLACAPPTGGSDGGNDAGGSDAGPAPDGGGGDGGQGGPDGGGTSDGGTDGGRADGGGADGGPTACDGGFEGYVDVDEDGFGVDDPATNVCTDPLPSGYASQAGDCGPTDPWRNPAGAEICDDNVDDDCDGVDADCPTTQGTGMDVPNWDCQTGQPPPNVVAYARFESGNGYFQDGACFVFFEGYKGEFYVRPVGLVRTSSDPSCDTLNGCTCPSLNGWPSYDRRLYAFTKADKTPCAEIAIRDHGGEDQPVSNDCRKYLYQLHYYDIPFNYLADDVEILRKRLTLFPTVEVACAEDTPHQNLPFASLMEASVVFNPNYVPK